jgi:hypothetical protein
VAASKESIASSLATAKDISTDLIFNDLLIVPLVIERDGPGNDYSLSVPSLSDIGAADMSDIPHVGIPIGPQQWTSIIKGELSAALSQTESALDKGVTIIIKKNGKVGTRRFGVPLWTTLIDEVSVRAEKGLDISNI